MKRDYKNYRLYLENENLVEQFNLNDTLYIAMEYIYNVTEKDTAMLKDGLDGVTAFNKVKKYLLQYMNIHIPDIKDPKTKVATAYGWYDELVKRGVLSFIGPYTYTAYNGTGRPESYTSSQMLLGLHVKNPKLKRIHILKKVILTQHNSFNETIHI